MPRNVLRARIRGARERTASAMTATSAVENLRATARRIINLKKLLIANKNALQGNHLYAFNNSIRKIRNSIRKYLLRQRSGLPIHIRFDEGPGTSDWWSIPLMHMACSSARVRDWGDRKRGDAHWSYPQRTITVLTLLTSVSSINCHCLHLCQPFLEHLRCLQILKY